MSKRTRSEERAIEEYAARAVKRDRISAQADAFAAILKVDPEHVMVDTYGVALTPDQADAILELLGKFADRILADHGAKP